MPILKWKDTRKLQGSDSIVSVTYVDGKITKAELVDEHTLLLTVGGEDIRIGIGRAPAITIGGNLKGFVVEYSIPDDGATVFTFYDFHKLD